MKAYFWVNDSVLEGLSNNRNNKRWKCKSWIGLGFMQPGLATQKNENTNLWCTQWMLVNLGIYTRAINKKKQIETNTDASVLSWIGKEEGALAVKIKRCKWVDL
jgi:hypothetical protein